MPLSRSVAPLLVAAALATSSCTPGAVPTPAAVVPASLPARIDPAAPLTREQQAWVDRTLASLTLRERVGQMLNVWVLGDFSSEDDSAFREVVRWVEEDRVGGLTMSVGSPVEVAVKVNALQGRARVPLLVASDLEPGLGRLEGGVFIPSMLYGGSATVFPTAMAMGAAGSDSLTRAAAAVIAREARAVGIHVVFGPVADVNNNPANPVINTRSFGESPRDVARHTSAFVRGLQDGGALATAKHFPGHGDTDTDSHLALPTVKSNRAQLDSVELVPFRAAVDAGVAAFMTAHIALPAIEGSNVPATLAPRVISDLLRDTLGFRGLTYTDALTMEAVGEGYPVERSAVLAVKAGADVLLKPSDIRRAIDAVVGAVERGEITAARVDSSARRMLEAKARAGLWRERLVDVEGIRRIVGTRANWALADELARRAVTLVRDSATLVPVAGMARRVAVVTYAPESELRAGRAFAATFRSSVPNARIVRLAPRSGRGELDSLTASLGSFDAVVVTTHVRTIEGAGRFAVAPLVAQWIDSLATRTRVVVVAHGNPYVIRQFPRVGSYVAAYGVGDALERASARAVLGLAPITGRSPISLPGFFARGQGLSRPAVNAAIGTASPAATTP